MTVEPANFQTFYTHPNFDQNLVSHGMGTFTPGSTLLVLQDELRSLPPNSEDRSRVFTIYNATVKNILTTLDPAAILTTAVESKNRFLLECFLKARTKDGQYRFLHIDDALIEFSHAGQLDAVQMILASNRRAEIKKFNKAFANAHPTLIPFFLDPANQIALDPKIILYRFLFGSVAKNNLHVLFPPSEMGKIFGKTFQLFNNLLWPIYCLDMEKILADYIDTQIQSDNFWIHQVTQPLYRCTPEERHLKLQNIVRFMEKNLDQLPFFIEEVWRLIVRGPVIHGPDELADLAQKTSSFHVIANLIEYRLINTHCTAQGRSFDYTLSTKTLEACAARCAASGQAEWIALADRIQNIIFHRTVRNPVK